ncbi:MAG: type II 3-dehydroquinate dehydratase [Gammaproteobacteria bacterium]|nr:type II 3-dehydroquinate dehydratase [Gammaproteobacteria bacterium]
MSTILVINGPNLNLLGKREPTHYGQDTLESIQSGLKKKAETAGHELLFEQSNSESLLIEIIHQAPFRKVDFILFNPAAFTHTSIALRDAILGVAIPFIEIHLSNVHAREAFRKQSYFSDIAVGVISGLGAQGYQLAFDAALKQIQPATS